MTTVDERVVEMRFDNRQFEEGVRTSLGTLERLKGALNLTQSAKSLTELEKAGRNFKLDGVAEGVDLISKRFSAMGIVGVTAIQNITNSAMRMGSKIIEALTIRAPKDGLQEYELQINSVQTIMANTGHTVKDVNGALDGLNEYADLTIYNFAEMTKNAGMFTAAGLGLEDTMVALKGVGNWAAYAGANSQEMGRATYQLGQALSAGSIRLQDWMSIEHAAGMAGEKYRDAFVKTAKEHGINVDAMIKANGSFRESLREGWLTTDIFMETMNKFANNKDMTDAATKVKTFTQLIDTIKEAVGSGWAQSWRLIIGDFEEAKALWTSINDYLTGVDGVLTKMSDSRNTMLQYWHDNGGRDDLLEGLKNSFQGLLSIIKPIHEAFRTIFPPTTGEQLVKMTASFKELTSHFKIGTKTAEAIQKAFEGLFSVVKLGITIVGGIAKVFGKLLTFTLPVVDGLVRVAGAVGDFVSNIGNASESTNIFAQIFQGLGNTIMAVATAIKEVAGPFIKKFFEGLETIFTGAAKTFQGFAEDMDIVGIFGVINAALFANVLNGLKKFMESLRGVVKDNTKFIASIKDTFGAVQETLATMQSTLKAATLLKIAMSVAVLTAAIVAMTMVDPKRLAAALGAITIMFTELFIALAMFNKHGVKSILELSKTTTALLVLASTINILAHAMTRISKIDGWGVFKSLLSIKVLMGALNKTMKGLVVGKKDKVQIMEGIGAMMAYAVAIDILARAVQKLASLNIKELGTGLAGVGALLAGLSIFGKYANKTGMAIKNAAGVVILAEAVAKLAKTVEQLGSIDIITIGKGLIGIGSLLTMLSVFTNTTKNVSGVITTATGLVVLSGALTILSKTVKTFGDMGWGELGKGLIGVGGSLGILAVGLNKMHGTLAASASVLVASSALAILGATILVLGSLGWKTVATGLVALAGALTIVGTAGALLTPIIPSIIALGGAIAMIGVGVATTGAGLLALGAGITAIAVAFGELAVIGTSGAVAVGTAITAIVTNVAKVVPVIAQHLANAIVIFVQTIANSATAVVQAVSTILLAVIQAISNTIPQIVLVLLDGVSLFLQGLAQRMPEIVDAGMTIVIKLMDGISKRLPELTESAFNLMLTFINSLADSVRTNAPKIHDAIVNLFKSLISAAISILTGAGPDFLKKGKEAITKFIDGVQAKFTSVKNSAKEMLAKFKEGIEAKIEEIRTAGKHAVEGFINGVTDKIEGVVKSAKSMGTKFLDNLKASLKEHSPSKATFQIAAYAVEGFINGLVDNSGKLQKTSIDLMRKGVVEPMQGAVDMVKKNLKYGENAFVEYLKRYTQFNPADATTVAELEKAQNSIIAFGEALYKESDQMKQDTKTLKEHQKELKKYEQTKKDIQAKLKKLDKDNSEKGKQKKEQLKEDLKDVEKSIKDSNKAIEEDYKNAAKNIQQIYNDLRKSISESVKGFTDPLKASLDTGIDLFKKFGSDAEEISFSEILNNMYSQVTGIKQWNEDLETLIQNGWTKGLVEKLKELGPSAQNYIKAFMNATVDEMNAANLVFEESSKMTADALIKNFSDSLAKAKEWKENMTKLSQAGLGQDLLRALGDMGPEGADYVNAFLQMGPEQAKQFNEYYKEFLKLPHQIADSVIADYANAGKNAFSGFLKALTGENTDDTEKDKSNETVMNEGIKTGENFAGGVETGVDNKKSDVEKKATEVAKATKNAMNTYISKSDGKELGNQMCAGLIEGLNNGSNAVTAAARRVAREAYEAAMKELGIHSPSRKFHEIGKFSDLGFANGLLEFAGRVKSASANVAKTAVDSMRNSIRKINDVVNGEMDANPVIRPTLDLSNVESESKKISSMFAATQSLKLAQMNAASGIGTAKRNNNIVNTNPNNQNGGGNTYSFVQNNYSPKALSRLDIYRQTKNQFSAMKGALDNK